MIVQALLLREKRLDRHHARERPDKSYQMAGTGTFTPGLPLQWDVDYWKLLNSGMLHHLNLSGTDVSWIHCQHVSVVKQVPTVLS